MEEKIWKKLFRLVSGLPLSQTKMFRKQDTIATGIAPFMQYNLRAAHISSRQKRDWCPIPIVVPC